ncbi:MAG TPA: hypothetical protein H9875_07030 [Candidatus Levilactobacillus faecigallinarum]|uniref:Uncharacterized protein n=1 Tax=Candidatus Levilactobacillus faecigallinarum TaxID=2838638 RepID=A0A9D1QRY1_9LACO|nr:hypothetical protein [Candidatus Levilactobacillus faecigallinarum]
MRMFIGLLAIVGVFIAIFRYFRNRKDKKKAKDLLLAEIIFVGIALWGFGGAEKKAAAINFDGVTVTKKQKTNLDALETDETNLVYEMGIKKLDANDTSNYTQTVQKDYLLINGTKPDKTYLANALMVDVKDVVYPKSYFDPHFIRVSVVRDMKDINKDSANTIGKTKSEKKQIANNLNKDAQFDSIYFRY